MGSGQVPCGSSSLSQLPLGDLRPPFVPPALGDRSFMLLLSSGLSQHPIRGFSSSTSSGANSLDSAPLFK